MSERSEVTFKLRAIADGYDCFPWRGEEMAGFAGRILNLLGGSEEAEAPGECRVCDQIARLGELAIQQGMYCDEHRDDPVPPRDKDIGSGSEDSRPEGTGGSSCKARRGGDAGQQTAASEPDASLHSTPKAEPGASDPCPTCGGSKTITVREGGIAFNTIPCPDCSDKGGER